MGCRWCAQDCRKILLCSKLLSSNITCSTTQVWYSQWRCPPNGLKVTREEKCNSVSEIQWPLKCLSTSTDCGNFPSDSQLHPTFLTSQIKCMHRFTGGLWLVQRWMLKQSSKTERTYDPWVDTTISAYFPEQLTLGESYWTYWTSQKRKMEKESESDQNN